jgi:hypothetical protein
MLWKYTHPNSNAGTNPMRGFRYRLVSFFAQVIWSFSVRCTVNSARFTV